jgi:hypothetical protein
MLKSQPNSSPAHAAKVDYLSFRRQLFNSETLQRIFDAYRERGGDPDTMAVLLWYLRPETKAASIRPPDPRPLVQLIRRKLIACEGAIAGLWPLLPDSTSRRVHSLRRALVAAKGELRKFRRSPAAVGEIFRPLGITTPPGRPKGPTADTVLVGVIVLEFRRRFGAPRFRDVLQLLREVGFPESTSEDHLRVRLRSLPETQLKALHTSLFPSPPGS